MIKINAYYTEHQMELLHLIVEKTGMKQSEHLRRAVDMYLDEMREQGKLDASNLQVQTATNK